MIVNACIKKYKSDTDLNLFIDYCNGVNTKLVAPKHSKTPFSVPRIYTKSLYAYYLDSFKKMERSNNSCMNYAGFNNYYIKTNYATRGSEIYLESYEADYPKIKYLRLLVPGIGFIKKTDSLELLDASYNIRTIELESLANLKYVNYNSVTNVINGAFSKCTNLKEIYLPEVITVSGFSASNATIYNCKNLDFVYLGPNVTDIPRYFLYNSTIKDALYIDKPRAEVEQFTGYAYRFSDNQLVSSKIICNDDPNWVKPTSKNPGIPISHIIQPIYKYNVKWSRAYYDLYDSVTSITDDIFTKPLLTINKYFCTDRQMSVTNININSATLLKSYGINSYRLTHVSLNGVTHIESYGIFDARSLKTLNLNGLKTYDENAIHANNKMIINLQSIVTLDKTLINNSAKKVYLDSVETINGLNAVHPVFDSTTNTIYYIGPNITDMNAYVFSYNKANTVYVDVPRATLETFSGYAKLFNNGGTNLTVICNDDPDWKSAEELRAED